MKQTNRTIKSIVALVLILCTVLVLSSCGTGTVSYSDAEGDVGELDWSFDASEKTLTVTGSGEIPDAASSADVAWKAIRGGVETVNLDPAITAIGDYAFYGMTALKKVSLPSGVSEIGKCAFAFAGKLTEIELPESLTAIGESAFEGCTALTSVVLPMSVTEIGVRSFAFCTALTNVVLVSLEEIPEDAFLSCRALKTLVVNTAFSEEALEPIVNEVDVEITRRDTLEDIYTIQITYVYEDGTEAKPTVEEVKPDGSSYAIATPTIEGYTPDIHEVQGTLAGEDVEIKVTYTKVTEEVETTEPEAETTLPAEEEEEDEPITGGTIAAIVVLVLVIAGIVVGAVLLLRSDKKNTKNAPKNQNHKKK